MSGQKTTLNQGLAATNGIVAFVLEVALLVAGFFWAFKTFAAPLGLILGLLIAVVLVAFWALLMAPKSQRRIRWPAQPLVALLLFVIAGIGLILVQATALGIVLIVVAAANTWLGFYLRRTA